MNPLRRVGDIGKIVRGAKGKRVKGEKGKITQPCPVRKLHAVLPPPQSDPLPPKRGEREQVMSLGSVTIRH
jgi:hypothetical protein